MVGVFMSMDHCEEGSPSKAWWTIPPSCCRRERLVERGNGSSGKLEISELEQKGRVTWRVSKFQSQSRDGTGSGSKQDRGCSMGWKIR